MKTAIRKILEISGRSFTGSIVTGVGLKNSELTTLLKEKNGFFAFEAALRVFPAGDAACSYGLDDWNSLDLWRCGYGELAEGLLFFAEDIFGTQFCLKEGKVYSFDPETADLTFVAKTIDEWAGKILKDYSLLTGYPLAHEWQVENGPLEPRNRLMPKTPFVLGGEFSIDNLVSIDGARSMRCRANLARQIHSLPDGTQIKFEIVD
jgi:hypothetical protein